LPEKQSFFMDNRSSSDGLGYMNSNHTQDDTQDDTQDSITQSILQYCTEPRSMDELLQFLCFKEKKSVRRRLTPLIEKGQIAMTIPDKPTSKNQKYVTVAG